MASYQGTFESIYTQVIEKLRLDETDDLQKAKDWVNLAYVDAVQQTGCLEATGDAALTANIASYVLPAAVAWIKSLVITYQDGSVSDPLQQVSVDEMLEQRRADVAVGQTQEVPTYAIAGQSRLEIWPTPGAGQTLTFWYVYLPTVLSGDSDTPVIMEPFGSKLLEYGALVEGARFKKDPLLTDYEQQYAMWLAKFQTWMNRRQTGGWRTARVILGPRPRVFANDVG